MTTTTTINDPDFSINITLNSGTEHNISFKQVKLSNIIDQGKKSDDMKDTYRRLADLSNDFKMLMTAFGPFFGRILFCLPVSWKANMYIKQLSKDIERNLHYAEWIMIDQNDRTLGILNLKNIDRNKLEMYDDDDLKLYNIGLMLHTDFQRKGFATELSNQLFNQLPHLDIDGLIIVTRQDNAGANKLASKLNFVFVKKMDVKVDNMIPCFSHNYLPSNIYIKKNEYNL